ncbi:MAG: hypothetical protein ACERLB_04865 [Gammaproteobacteria bacterium]
MRLCSDAKCLGWISTHVNEAALIYFPKYDARFCFNCVIASAQETNASVGYYMDYLLDQSSTRVIAILQTWDQG